MNKVIYAGGCFWCVEHDLKEAPGVLASVSGYTGEGSIVPSYENHTGFREAVEVEYDNTKTNFKKLTQYFLDHIDPTDAGGQFGDRGESYQTAIYYSNEEEKMVAESLLRELADSHIYEKSINVQVLPSQKFYKAEEYHQNYAEKNPAHYSMYRQGSGRQAQVDRTCAIREEKHINWKN